MELPSRHFLSGHSATQFWRVGRAELCLCLWGGGGSKQLKIPPGGRFGRGCQISYIFFGGGGGGGGVFLGNLETPMATPLQSLRPPRNNSPGSKRCKSRTPLHK